MWSVDTILPLPVPCCHTDHHSLKSQPWVKLIWWQWVDWEQKNRAQRCHVGDLYWHCLGRLPFLISKIGLLIVDICGWMVYSSTGFISLQKYHRATPKWQVCSVTITVVKICECYTSEKGKGISIQEQRTGHQPSFWPLWTISFGCKPIQLWGQRELCLFFNGSNFEASHWSWPQSSWFIRYYKQGNQTVITIPTV